MRGSLPILPGKSGKVIKKELRFFCSVEKCIVKSLQTQWEETSSNPLGVICISGHLLSLSPLNATIKIPNQHQVYVNSLVSSGRVTAQSSVVGTRYMGVQFSSVQLLSHVWLFATPWTAACQAFLSITNSQNLLKLMSIELVMLSNHLILSRPLLFPPSIFPSIRVFSNESVLHIRWPKYWSFSFSISPSNEYSVLISFRMDWLDLIAV